MSTPSLLHGELVQLAAEPPDTNMWAVPGVTSIQHWLTWRAGITATHADTVVRLAKARSTHPETMAVFADGAISFDQAAIAVKAPGYLDGEFAELAQYATVAQLRLLVRAARPSPCPKPPAPDPVESLSGWFDDDGRYHLRGDLDPDHGRIVDAALGEARDALFQAGQTDVTTAEALVEMAQRSLNGQPRQRRERFRANWFIDPTRPVPATWTDGLAVPQWLTDLLGCDGTVSPIYTEGELPVNVGRTMRIPRQLHPRVFAVPVSPSNTRVPDPRVNHPRRHTRVFEGPPKGTANTRDSAPDRAGCSPRPARHQRQRRPTRRARLHRRTRPGHRPRHPADQTHQPTTRPRPPLPPPPRRTVATRRHHVPRTPSRLTSPPR